MARPQAGVVVRFPRTTELLYLRRPPRRGQRIADRAGAVFVVTEVVPSGRAVYTARCVGLGEFLAGVMSSPEGASDVLAMARKVIRSNDVLAPKEQRDALTRHEDWIEQYLRTYSAQRRVTGEVRTLLGRLTRPIRAVLHMTHHEF